MLTDSEIKYYEAIIKLANRKISYKEWTPSYTKGYCMEVLDATLSDNKYKDYYDYFKYKIDKID